MQISRLVLAYAFTISIVMSAFHGSVAMAASTGSSGQQGARSYSDYQREISEKQQLEAAQKQVDDAKKAIDAARANAMNAKSTSINEAAKKQKQQSVIGTVAGLGMAAFCAYQATQTCNNWATAGYCALSVSGMALSMVAVSMAMKSGKQSVASMEDLTVPDVAATGATATANTGAKPGSAGNNPSDVLNAILGNPTAPNSAKKNAAQVKAALDDLSKKGIKVDLDKQTVTTPDGKVTSVSAMMGAGGGGLGSGGGKGAADFAAVMAAAKEAGAKAAQAADVTEGWDTGGGATSAASNSGSAGAGFPTFNPMAGMNANAANFGREPAAFAASTSQFNGDALLPADANMWVQMNLRHEWLGQRGKVNPDLAPPSPQQ